ncbi:LOW QUALITY PROTEIN: hypothetical protein SETIT_9G101300v2 [Setaria italica]|uniref:Uncharacterized protein n=1 Tax=Setaria italica TaxID=4555 RepID=A0A368SEZ0_SETIT|nr:LOW QUALITY PROTEIN: hypothetical protein SETIT_9G101300v2 [Setaria italica]
MAPPCNWPSGFAVREAIAAAPFELLPTAAPSNPCPTAAPSDAPSESLAAGDLTPQRMERVRRRAPDRLRARGGGAQNEEIGGGEFRRRRAAMASSGAREAGIGQRATARVARGTDGGGGRGKSTDGGGGGRGDRC